ncbi:MAG TPA: CpaF family protein [Chloroflexia bacterium]|nr:CpaF family protein [Chloroflexia bacterium]
MFSKREGARPPGEQTETATGAADQAALNDGMLGIPADLQGITPLLPAEHIDTPLGPPLSPFMPVGPEVDVADVLKPLIEGNYIPTGERPGLKRAMLGDDTLDPEPYIQAQGRSNAPQRQSNGTTSHKPAPAREVLPGTGPLPELVLPPLPDPAPAPAPTPAPAPAQQARQPQPAPADPAPSAEPSPADLARLQVSPLLVYALVQRMMSGFPQGVLLDKTPEIEQMLAGRFIAALSQVPGPIPPGGQEALFAAVMDEILGLGPLQSLVNDDSVTEIMVNDPAHVWVERHGQTMESGVTFQNEEHVARIAQRILKPFGRPLDRRHPIAEARLPDGSRVNIIAPPCAVHGTTITIRKFSRRLLTLEEMVAADSLTPTVAAFLQACVAGRINLFVTGGASSGKTTLLNALASFIPAAERIVTVEESAQLRLDRPNVVSLEALPAEGDDGAGVGLDRLVSSALKMRPDRIVVGELRGPEAADLLHAMNTGFDGSLATLYATSPADALARLEAMAATGRRGYPTGWVMPERLLREQIAAAVDLVLHLARLRDGSRHLASISEVQGMEGDAIVLTPIFRRDDAGDLVPTGHIPRLLQRLADNGQHFEPAVFEG